MSSPARQANSLEKPFASFHDNSCAGFKAPTPIRRAANGHTAFSIEFVAKPEQAAGAPLFLPETIQSGLGDIAGFAGSLVMVSDQEARLITLIIFWNGTEARRNCERIVRRVRALLAPYLDRCLRMQTLLAHAPKAQDFPQPSSIDTCFITGESITSESNAEEANACVA